VCAGCRQASWTAPRRRTGLCASACAGSRRPSWTATHTTPVRARAHPHLQQQKANQQAPRARWRPACRARAQRPASRGPTAGTPCGRTLCAGCAHLAHLHTAAPGAGLCPPSGSLQGHASEGIQDKTGRHAGRRSRGCRGSPSARRCAPGPPNAPGTPCRWQCRARPRTRSPDTPRTARRAGRRSPGCTDSPSARRCAAAPRSARGTASEFERHNVHAAMPSVSAYSFAGHSVQGPPWGPMMMMPFNCSYRNKNEPSAIYPSLGYSPPRKENKQM
jgi:hypothetical protein